MKLPRLILLIDDAFVVFVITLFGVSFHQSGPLIERLPYTFFPFLVAWVVSAAALRLYDPQIYSNIKQLWRVPITAAIAAPIASSARALWLGMPVVPVFAVVMAGALMIGFLLSRLLFALVFRDRWMAQDHG
jgi:hypothetical protein